jgi:hypothetical protein
VEPRARNQVSTVGSSLKRLGVVHLGVSSIINIVQDWEFVCRSALIASARFQGLCRSSHMLVSPNKVATEKTSAVVQVGQRDGTERTAGYHESCKWKSGTRVAMQFRNMMQQEMKISCKWHDGTSLPHVSPGGDWRRICPSPGHKSPHSLLC